MGHLQQKGIRSERLTSPAGRGFSRIVGHVKLTARRVLVVAGAAVAVIAAAGTALAVGVPSNPAPGTTSQTVTVPANGHANAALQVAAGTPVLSIRVADLGGTHGTLLRATTPDGAPRPEVRAGDGAAAGRSDESDFVSVSASDGSAPVTITLNSAVTWLLDFAGGTQRTVADLRGGRVAGIIVAAGLGHREPDAAAAGHHGPGPARGRGEPVPAQPAGRRPGAGHRRRGAPARCRWTARTTPASAAARCSPRRAGRRAGRATTSTPRPAYRGSP